MHTLGVASQCSQGSCCQCNPPLPLDAMEEEEEEVSEEEISVLVSIEESIVPED